MYIFDWGAAHRASFRLRVYEGLLNRETKYVVFWFPNFAQKQRMTGVKRVSEFWFGSQTRHLSAEIRLSAISKRQSKISTAEAITVVQSPRLSPTADWVTFAVRTILFEMR